MYQGRRCLCIDTTYGLNLENRRQQLLTKGLYKDYAEYGASDCAISHCWSDELFLDDNIVKQVITLLAPIGKPWLDIAQIAPFNALKCRAEYTNKKVIIVEPTTMIFS